MNKKVLALMSSAALVAAIGLAGCGSDQAPSSSASDASQSSTSAATQSQSSSNETQPSNSASAETQQSSSADATAQTQTMAINYSGTSEDDKYNVTFTDEFTTQSEIGTLVITNTDTGEVKEYKGSMSYTQDGADSICTLDDGKGSSITFKTVSDEDLNISFIFDEYGTVKMETPKDSVVTTETNSNQSDASQSSSTK